MLNSLGENIELEKKFFSDRKLTKNFLNANYKDNLEKTDIIQVYLFNDFSSLTMKNNQIKLTFDKLNLIFDLTDKEKNDISLLINKQDDLINLMEYGTARIRKSNEKYFFTLKIKNGNLGSYEFEPEITDFRTICFLDDFFVKKYKNYPYISKVRKKISYDGLSYEFDFFKNKELSDLCYLEIEFNSEEDYFSFNLNKEVFGFVSVDNSKEKPKSNKKLAISIHNNKIK